MSQSNQTKSCFNCFDRKQRQSSRDDILCDSIFFNNDKESDEANINKTSSSWVAFVSEILFQRLQIANQDVSL